MKLRGKTPEPVNKRLKLFLYGSPGSGKTTSIIQCPNSYIIDGEKGTDHYHKTITQNKSVVFQSNIIDEVVQELKQLLTTKHQYRTLIIDPITPIYLSCQEKWTRIFEKDALNKGKDSQIQNFGMRFWGKVKSEFKAMQRILLSLDMNVLITAHQKDQYGLEMQKIGVQPDSMKGDSYLFDLVFRLEKNGNKYIAITEKERAEIGHSQFPDTFEWSYDNLVKFYGKDTIEKEAVPVIMANPALIKEVEKLVEVIKVDPMVIEKWFDKESAETWLDFTQARLEKCHDYLLAQLKNIKGAK